MVLLTPARISTEVGGSEDKLQSVQVEVVGLVSCSRTGLGVGLTSLTGEWRVESMCAPRVTYVTIRRIGAVWMGHGHK